MSTQAKQTERIGRPRHDDSLTASPTVALDPRARSSRDTAAAGPKPTNGSAAQSRRVIARIAPSAEQPTTEQPTPVPASDLVEAFRAELTERIGAAAVSRHLTDDTRIDIRDTHVAVAGTTNFHKSMRERRFASAMAKIATELGLQGVRIDLQALRAPATDPSR